MKSQQSGFTLVEIAIVLVIIGLLLGGILKGQELINSAKVKNLANDFRTIPTYIYAYQDKFKSLPGDDCLAETHVTAAPPRTCRPRLAEGQRRHRRQLELDDTGTDESFLFWQHVRLANLAAGPTDTRAAATTYRRTPSAAASASRATDAQTELDHGARPSMRGTYQICSKGILGKFAKQLDIQMDDGNTASGSLRAVADGAALGCRDRPPRPASTTHRPTRSA